MPETASTTKDPSSKTLVNQARKTIRLAPINPIRKSQIRKLLSRTRRKMNGEVKAIRQIILGVKMRRRKMRVRAREDRYGAITITT